MHSLAEERRPTGARQPSARAGKVGVHRQRAIGNHPSRGTPIGARRAPTGDGPSTSNVQLKARLGHTRDPLEHEADAAARHLTSGRSVDVAPMTSPTSAGEVPADVAGSIERAAGGGAPLPDDARETFGARLGRDLSRVRVHTDGRAAELARDLSARAFTVRDDIFFGRGEYRPGSADGQRLLAHELVHTAQQAGGSSAVQRQDLDELGNRAWNWGSRQWSRAERLGERAGNWAGRQADRAERATAAAGRAAEAAAEEAEAMWNSGTGAVSRIDFDGSTLTLSGSVSYSTSAVSGLKASNGRAGGVDWTDPSNQAVPNKGPIPEGEYYVEPDEVENARTHGFSSGPWGHYRTRLHATLLTTASRRLFTDRTGGFFLHKDGGNDGTAGCIGITTHGANRVVHDHIAANSARIPVHVEYPPPAASPAPAADEGSTVQRMPLAERELVVQRQVLPDIAVVQRQDETAQPQPHYLIQAGLDRLAADVATYGVHNFPNDYYDTLARHLYGVALERTGRDYAQSFELLNDLQWGEFGAALRREYTRVVGTDNTNGWDKVRHFVYTAVLQYRWHGFLAPEIFTYGKEIWDAAEGLVGADPEGYSVDDIRADNRGELFAEQMRARELAEQRARTRADLRRMRRVFIDQNPADVRWFITNFGR